jgi:hypothetical protein
MVHGLMRLWSSAVFVAYMWAATWLCMHALPIGVLAFLLWPGTAKLGRWFDVGA